MRVLATALLLAFITVPSQAQVKVVATTPDLADIAERIGGELVKVDSLTQGHEDLHLVTIRPSLLIKVRRADVFLQIGLDAEHSWVPALLRSARNRKVRPGGSGFVDCSANITPLEIPTSKTRDQGVDLHPSGNPHYNLDPEMMRQAARNIHAGLKRAAPDGAKALDAGLAAWEKELDTHIAGWKTKMTPARDAPFIEFHRGWVYFAERYGLKLVARLEPKPGLAPTPSHLSKVVETARAHSVKLVVARPQNLDIAQKVVAEAGGTAVALQLGSSREGPQKGWFAFMDHVVEIFSRELARSK